jgi:ATP-binding cassette, subfamily B, bacterial
VARLLSWRPIVTVHAGLNRPASARKISKLKRKNPLATFVAIVFIATMSVSMAATLMVLAGILVFTMSRLAAAGRPLHHEFANRAAAVDGEMFDVIGNIPLVWSFCGVGREHSRLDATIDREMAARRRSLYYLEKLRLFHAAITIVLTIALLAWAIALWQNGAATCPYRKPKTAD